jgi:Amt family ammonium transporter
MSGYMGGFGGVFYNPSDAELALLGADEATEELVAAVTANGYSVASDWFFQMVFVATAASIVSGTVAERIKLWPFLIFVVILTGIIYPIQGSWTWGGGWLAEMGFSDFAGSTIVHSVGGWAALTGAIILGARKGKYGSDGSRQPDAGRQSAARDVGHVHPVARLVRLQRWFAARPWRRGLDATWPWRSSSPIPTWPRPGAWWPRCILTQILYKKIDLTMALNGAIAGLVSITAGPDLTNHFWSIVIGAIGGIIVVIAIPLLDKLKIDDVVGAISAHLVAGIWGTLAVGIFGGGDLIVQIIGIVAIGAFTIVASGIVWFLLKATIGLRVSEEDEMLGLDKAELGMEAYPEFGQGSSSM